MALREKVKKFVDEAEQDKKSGNNIVDESKRPRIIVGRTR